MPEREPVVGDRVMVFFSRTCVLYHMEWHRGALGTVTAIYEGAALLPSEAGPEHKYYVHVDGDQEDFTKRYASHELEVVPQS